MALDDVFIKLGLDSKDREILFELDLNSRISVNKLAKKARLKPGTVNYRIKKLEEKKIILGYYTAIDTSLLGFEQFRVYLKYQYINPEQENELMNYLHENKMIWWLGKIGGEFDLCFVIWAKNSFEFNEFWKKFMLNYRNLFQKMNVSVYTELTQFNLAFLNHENKKRIKIVSGKKERIKISEKEREILRIISADARIPSIEIAKKLNITPIQAKYALDKMKKQGLIQGFRIKFNFDLFGLNYYKVNFNLKDMKKYNKLVDFALEHERIIYVDQSIGFADFEIELVASSHKEFTGIIKEMKEKFSEIIKDYDFILYSEILKIKYF
ncbi:MAG: winged helix-turn-helix transcriptional regulator [archaeon]